MVRHQNQTKQELETLINNALNILNFSLILYTPDDHEYNLSCNQERIISTSFEIDINHKTIEGEINRIDNPIKLRLDKQWANFHQQFFFHKLLKIVYPKKKTASILDNKWKRTILNVVSLIGQAGRQVDWKQGFLINMIAFEMLLTQGQESYSSVLPKRVEAFISWVENWTNDGIYERIRDVYGKRCQIVHEGNFDCILESDFEFIKELNFILLWNITLHIKHFRSKSDLIEFCRKKEAEKLLAIKRSSVFPKKLRFLSSRKSYSSELSQYL